MKLARYPKAIDVSELRNLDQSKLQTMPSNQNRAFLYFVSLAITVAIAIFIFAINSLSDEAIASISKFLESIPFLDLKISTDVIHDLRFPGPFTNALFTSNLVFLGFVFFDTFHKNEIKKQSDLFRESSSVSYSIHLAILVCVLFAVMFSVSPRPKIQTTRIEYIPVQVPSTKPPPKSVTRKASKQSIDSGKHDPKKPITPVTKPSGDPGHKAQSKPVAKPKVQPTPKPATEPSQAKPDAAPRAPQVMDRPKAVPKPKSLREAIEPDDKPSPTKTLPKLLDYGSGPGPTSSYGGSGTSPTPLGSSQSRSGDGRDSGLIARLGNIPKAPDSTGGGSGGAYGAPGNPGPNAYPDRSPSLAAQASANMGPYMSALQRKIKMAWRPPRGTESNRIVVSFTVLTNGSIESLKIVQHSPYAEADQAAIEAVNNAAPFQPLPDGAGPKIDIEFTFDYNVFQKTRF